METILEVVQIAVLLFIEVMGYAMLIRAILSIIGFDESMLYVICYAVSEPVVDPVRLLLNRVTSLREIGIDFSFMVTYLLLEVVRIFLLSFS